MFEGYILYNTATNLGIKGNKKTFFRIRNLVKINENEYGMHDRQFFNGLAGALEI